MNDEPRQVDVNQTPRSSEVATLLRAAQRRSADELDVALCGVPFDGGSSFRAGARHGPAQIREMSRLIRRAHHLSGVAPFDLCRVADVGDAPVNPLDMDATLTSVQGFFESIADAEALPLAVGGDHTVTLPILRAVARGGPVGLLQIDAHSDTQNTMLGQRFANGTPIRRAIEEGLVDPQRTVQIGIRGTLFAADELDWPRQQGVTIVTIEELDARGCDDVIARSRQTLGSGACYVTVDIDVLDPAYAPGTGGLEPGGMTVRELQRLIRGMEGLAIAGADVVEVSPPLDPTGNTALVACNLMFELLCLMASNSTECRSSG